MNLRQLVYLREVETNGLGVSKAAVLAPTIILSAIDADVVKACAL